MQAYKPYKAPSNGAYMITSCDACMNLADEVQNMQRKQGTPRPVTAGCTDEIQKPNSCRCIMQCILFFYQAITTNLNVLLSVACSTANSYSTDLLEHNSLANKSYFDLHLTATTVGVYGCALLMLNALATTNKSQCVFFTGLDGSPTVCTYR